MSNVLSGLEKVPYITLRNVMGSVSDDGFKIRECYSLQLEHSFAFVPAMYVDSEQRVISADRQVMIAVWKRLPRFRSVLVKEIYYVHETSTFGFQIATASGIYRKPEHSVVEELLTGECFRDTDWDSLLAAYMWRQGFLGTPIGADTFRAQLHVAEHGNAKIEKP